MIKNTNKKESRKIAKNLNIYVKKLTKALSFTQDGDAQIALLDIKYTSNLIVHRVNKNPEQAHNLRWIRNTHRNKRILAGYLMRRVVKYILGNTGGMCYMPCCNSFSDRKPKEGHGHKEVTTDCLLLLLGEEIKSKSIAFKNQERQKNKMISQNEFLRLFRPKILPFFKDKTPLEWIGAFIERLPKKDGCFRLPLIKNKPFPKCPGACPLEKSNKALQFKVDLLNPPPKATQTNTLNPSPPSLRKNPRYTQSSKKTNKKLKEHFISAKKRNSSSKISSSPPQSNYPSESTFIKSEPPIAELEPRRVLLQKKIRIFSIEPSPGTKANFGQWSKETAHPKTSLFNEESEFPSEDIEPFETGQIANLVNQVNQLDLSDLSEQQDTKIYGLLSQVNQLQMVSPSKRLPTPLDDNESILNKKSNQMADKEVREAESHERSLSKRSMSMFEQDLDSSDERRRQEEEDYFRVVEKIKQVNNKTYELVKKNEEMDKEFDAWLKAFRAKSRSNYK